MAFWVGALLLVGVASSVVHSHEADADPSCSVCVLASTPADDAPIVVTDFQPVENGAVETPSARPFGTLRGASCGARAPPVTA